MQKDKLIEVAKAIAIRVASNASVAPELCFPHIYLGLKDLLEEVESAPVQPVAVQDGEWKRLGYTDEADYLRVRLNSTQATIKAHQSVLADRDAEIVALKSKLAAPAAQGDAKGLSREAIESIADNYKFNEHYRSNAEAIQFARAIERAIAAKAAS